MSSAALNGLLSVIGLVALVAALPARAQPAAQLDTIPPPLSVARAQYLRAHPTALAQFMTQLPHGLSAAPQPTAQRALSPAGGSWQAVTAAPVSGLANPLLLTDGSVMVASGNSPYWYKLIPDQAGNYADGTWTQLASLPVIGGTQYAPLYHASAVLPDGRVIIMGGEYNGSNTEVWTNLGAIYDPLANAWTAVAAPSGSGWTQIGDAQSVILSNGTFMLASCCAFPDANAMLDAPSLTWTATGAPNAGGNYQDEQGYELLPNGNVLTIDIWTNYDSGGNATNAEQYSPEQGLWGSAGNTPVSLPDPHACGYYEIGPAVLRAVGTVVAFAGNTGCTSSPADPTAIYGSATGTWVSGPNVPQVCGTGGTTSCDLADAGAALLPDGNILFDASAGYGAAPTHFFEFTPKNKIHQVSDPLYNANAAGAYYYNLLLLPNGQVLVTDFSNTPELYTPIGSPLSGIAPVITKVPSSVVRGLTYRLHGKQLNGRSQGGYYGDDVQTATNYPIVRITNTATGHVFYARTANHSTMSVAKNVLGATSFTVPGTIETGASTLSVIANGVASLPVSIAVK